MKKFCFFDLDGTLADTDRDIRLAWKEALADMGLSCEDFDRLFVTGPSIDDMARRLFPDRYSESFVAELRKRFGEHYDGDGFPSTREYPGVIDRVKAMKAAGAKVFIVTNKRFAGATAMARRFGWDGIFDGIYASDMYASDPATGKLAKPALLRRVMAELGARPEDSVMVGDTENDFAAAAENGVESVAVSWGYGTARERSLAARTVDSPGEI